MKGAIVLPSNVPCWCGLDAKKYGRQENRSMGDRRFSVLEVNHRYRCKNGHRLRYGIEHEINYLDPKPRKGVISATNGDTLGGENGEQGTGDGNSGSAGKDGNQPS